MAARSTWLRTPLGSLTWTPVSSREKRTPHRPAASMRSRVFKGRRPPRPPVRERHLQEVRHHLLGLEIDFGSRYVHRFHPETGRGFRLVLA